MSVIIELIDTMNEMTIEEDMNLNGEGVNLESLREDKIIESYDRANLSFELTLESFKVLQVHTSKIVATGVEGGANIFKLDYFNQDASLQKVLNFISKLVLLSLTEYSR